MLLLLPYCETTRHIEACSKQSTEGGQVKARCSLQAVTYNKCAGCSGARNVLSMHDFPAESDVQPPYLLTALDPGHSYLDTDLIKVMSVYGFKR